MCAIRTIGTVLLLAGSAGMASYLAVEPRVSPEDWWATRTSVGMAAGMAVVGGSLILWGMRDWRVGNRVPAEPGKAGAQTMQSNHEQSSTQSTRLYVWIAGTASAVLLTASCLIFRYLSREESKSYAEFFGPVAESITLIWLVAGFWLQRVEFAHQVRRVSMQRQVLEETLANNRRSMVISFSSKYVERLCLSADEIVSCLYDEDDTNRYRQSHPVLPHQREFSVHFLLAQSDLADRLAAARAADNYLPLIHASTFVTVHAGIAELISGAEFPEASTASPAETLLIGGGLAELSIRLQRALENINRTPDLPPRFE
jgi:hypothetical protein